MYNMKKIVMLFVMAFVALAASAQCTGNCGFCANPCGAGAAQTNTQTVNKEKAAKVVLLYLHSPQRCSNCIAVEKEAKALMDKEFAKLAKEGKVEFKVVDMSSEEGKKLAKKYKVTWSSLFMITYKGNKAYRTDLTDMAFSNAKKNPETFRSEMVKKVNNALK